MKDLTFRIRHARHKAKMTQTALAKLLGLNRSAVAQWERLGGSRPTSANLAKVAVATAIHFEWLATGRGRMFAPVDSSGETPALLLQFYAHDEVEERVLIAMRKVTYWQRMTIAELAESLARGKLSS